MVLQLYKLNLRILLILFNSLEAYNFRLNIMFKKATQFLILSCIIVATLSLTFSGVDHQKVMSHMMTIHNSAHLF